MGILVISTRYCWRCTCMSEGEHLDNLGAEIGAREHLDEFPQDTTHVITMMERRRWL
jgi:hypothetical protein